MKQYLFFKPGKPNYTGDCFIYFLILNTRFNFHTFRSQYQFEASLFAKQLNDQTVLTDDLRSSQLQLCCFKRGQPSWKCKQNISNETFHFSRSCQG